MPGFLQYFQVSRYDARGHGASAVPAGDFTIDQLGQDALGLVDTLGITKFAFCGLSMGGAVGQWLAIRAPERLTGLVLANTSAKFGTPDLWDVRRKAVLDGGMQTIVDAVMQRFFSPDKQTSAAAQSTRAVLLGTDPKGYAACCAALRDADNLAALSKISIPTLVIGSDRDPSTPGPGHKAKVLLAISRMPKPSSWYGASLNLELPHACTEAVLEFFIPAKAGADPLEAGMKVRRQVLGDAHVQRSMDGATDFTRDIQELITRYAWGTIWTRPGLDHRTRRLLVLAITQQRDAGKNFGFICVPVWRTILRS